MRFKNLYLKKKKNPSKWSQPDTERQISYGAGRDWGQEEKGMTEDEMAGWHHWLNGHESQWTPGVGDGQGGLACCDSWGRKEWDTTERLIWSLMVLMVKNCQCRRHKTWRFDPWVRKIPWRRAWQPTPVSMPGESHGQGSLVGYTPWGRRDSDTTEAT